MLNQHAIHNQKPIQFFTIPSIKKIQTTQRGTEGRIRKEKAVINNKQHEAWLHAIKNKLLQIIKHSSFSSSAALSALRLVINEKID